METKVGDILFLDTNVLLAATDQSRDHHQAAQHVLVAANRCGLHLGLSGQIIREYLVVATRPEDVNGLGLCPEDALNNVAQFRRRTVFYEEEEAVSEQLRGLVGELELKSKRIHDANVVATMRVHGISTLITGNTGDFTSFKGICPKSIEGADQAMQRVADSEHSG